MRSVSDRIREFRYRTGQSFVFGVPVLALQWFGPHLGGPEAPRWIGILQALLSGWILYVAAGGMLFEGILERSWKLLPDALVALLAIGLYLFSLTCLLPVFVTGRMLAPPLMFHWAVTLLMCWTAIRWGQLAGQSGNAPDL
jgi:hypothetical protein